jgi:hypothetical protein
MAITYQDEKKANGGICVKLDGRIVGHIKRDNQGWFYRPSGAITGKFSEHFPTLAGCKRSLES